MGTEETKKYEDRFRIIVAMGLFTLFVFIWSSCVAIVSINAADKGGDSRKEDTKKDEADSGSIEKEISIDDIGKKLLDGGEFSAKMTKATDDMAGNLVFASNKSELLIYLASGTYADEIILIKSEDKGKAESDKAAVEQHLADKKDEFEKYNAKEAKKIDNAYVVCKDCYVAACVSNNSEQAEKIITEALK